MFRITNGSILDISSPFILYKGEEYKKSNKVKSLKFNKDKASFEALVQGTECYYVKVNFKSDGKIGYTNCTCPTYEKYWGVCKHVVAVLLCIKDKNEQGAFDDEKSRQASSRFFDYFSARPSAERIPLDMEITYEFHKNVSNGSVPFSGLGIRLGTGKLYFVKSLKKLFESIETNSELIFGKRFTFNPQIHFFRQKDAQVIELIKELYETEKITDRFSYGYGKPGVFRDGQVLLGPLTTKRFFEIMDTRPFNAVIQDKLYENIKINKSDLPVEFAVGLEEKDLILDLGFSEPMIPLTADGEYIFADKAFYRVSNERKDSIRPFLLAYEKSGARSMRFTELDRERFVSEVLPVAQKAGRVNIHENVQSIIERVDLEVMIYLDNEENIVTADIKFVYGDKTINPFSSLPRTKGEEEKILLRDVEKERTIIEIFENSDFKVRNGKIFLDDEEKLFEFISDVMPRLREHSEIFYTDGFKKVLVRDPSSYRGGVRLNTLSGFLEFSFNMPGIDKEELNELFSAVKLNKKYHRFRDGSFISLKSGEIDEMAKMFRYLDVDPEDFSDGCIEIPRYRAFYLEKILENMGAERFEKNHAFKQLVQSVREPDDIDIVAPLELEGTLRDYQKYGFKWLKTLASYGLGGILADDMGLGKTVQVISLLLSEKLEKGPAPSIIIVPSSLLYNWKYEINKFTSNLSALVYMGVKKERKKLVEEIAECDVIITSYPIIRRDIDELSGIGFRYCILDEAQHIKNPDSENSKSVKKIKSEKRFALTGTPIENTLTELWSIFDFLLPGYLFNRTGFMEKYEKPIIKEENRETLEDLKDHIRPFILRRLKKDVLKELPEKIETKILTELTPEQKKVYHAFLVKLRQDVLEDIEKNGFERSQIKILAALTRLRQICCHPSVFIRNYKGDSGKMLLLHEIIRDLLEGGHRILLFSQFTSMLKIIEKWMQSQKIPSLYLDGATSIGDRASMVKAFNSGTGDVFLISLKAGGTGLNLTGADTVIHFDPWWNPAVEDQATDRAYRIGQNRAVQVIKVVSKDTIEEKIVDLQENKKRMIDSVIKPGETMLSKLSQEEIKALFE